MTIKNINLNCFKSFEISWAGFQWMRLSIICLSLVNHSPVTYVRIQHSKYCWCSWFQHHGSNPIVVIIVCTHVKSTDDYFGGSRWAGENVYTSEGINSPDVIGPALHLLELFQKQPFAEWLAHYLKVIVFKLFWGFSKSIFFTGPQRDVRIAAIRVQLSGQVMTKPESSVTLLSI